MPSCRRTLALSVLPVCLFLVPDAVGGPAPAPRYASVRLDGVPHVRQKPDFCGEACVEMELRRLGHPISQDDVFALAAVDPAEGRGAVTRELAAALRRLGFDPGPVWYTVRSRDAARALEAQFAALHADLRAGAPSIVCTRFDESPRTTEHFRLVTGYDARTDEVLYHDPAEATGAYLRMPRRRLLSLWPLRYQPRRWTVVRMPLRAGRITAGPATAGRHSRADFAQHVRALRQRLPRGFHLVIEPPFVVVGNENLGTVRARAEGTVRWAATRLKRAYFTRDPEKILDIWLFKDAATYRRYSRQLFGGDPGTPYGFYSATHGALVMNIATGGGTLVHEIVHPFMEANFADCPAWFNEGLGSLYEQAARCGEHICGWTNWRLAGLQQAIRARTVPTFEWLTSRTVNQFYGEDPGTNYAQSRYLLYYLQEKGVLHDYYRRFHAARLTDPTGHATLQALLKVADMAAFQRTWERWVLGLRYP